MSLTCHLERAQIPFMMLHPLEDVDVWLDDVAFDDDNTPIWRYQGALFFDDVMILT
jgi:hypothetical protein